MLISILKGAPLWAWGLLALLIYLGLKATTDRTRSAWPVYVQPLLGLLSVNSVQNLSPHAFIWVIFVLAYLLGAFSGFRYQRGLVQAKNGNLVTCKGEWLTLTVLMVVFWLNFAGGAIEVIAPNIHQGQFFQIIFSAIAGSVAGLFLGRAASVFFYQDSAKKV